MKKAVTIRDVAALAGVSVGTVSMVLNNSRKVSAHTREIVLSAIAKLGYVRNPFARSFSLSRSNTIGFVVTDLTNPFFGMMAGYLHREADQRDHRLVLGVTDNTIRQERSVIESLADGGVDGFLIVPAQRREPDLTHIYNLSASGKPTVFISSHYTGIRQNCVMTDLTKGSYDMATHLLQSGHRDIAFISGLRGPVLSEMRIEGFLRAFRDMGVAVSQDQIIEADPVFDGGYKAAKHILSDRRPDAIMAVNDLLCLGVLSYLRENGIRVPDDISVAGYDDLIYSSMLETPLTTVRQPIKRMCAEAVSLLFDLIDGGAPTQEPILLEPKIIVRSSTRVKEAISEGPLN